MRNQEIKSNHPSHHNYNIMKRITGFLLLAVLYTACTPARTGMSSGNNYEAKPSKGMYNAETFLLTGISEDSTYGYTPENAIKVGAKGSAGNGPTRERQYLNALMGPEKELVVYERKGSCCAVKSENGFGGFAMLDRYEVKYDGLEKPIILYLNMYDPRRNEGAQRVYL
jgi:hypothetical protein